MKTALAGRLAFRVEGEMWNVYWAPQQTSMDGAVPLGSLRMSLARVPALKDAFMQLMKDSLEVAAKDALGTEIHHWGDPARAPERERSGRA